MGGCYLEAVLHLRLRAVLGPGEGTLGRGLRTLFGTLWFKDTQLREGDQDSAAQKSSWNRTRADRGSRAEKLTAQG